MVEERDFIVENYNFAKSLTMVYQWEKEENMFIFSENVNFAKIYNQLTIICCIPLAKGEKKKITLIFFEYFHSLHSLLSRVEGMQP